MNRSKSLSNIRKEELEEIQKKIEEIEKEIDGGKNKEPKFPITIRQEEVEDIIGWTKIMITICSAAVATLLVKFDALSPPGQWFKYAAAAFLVSLIMLLFSYLGLIDHKRENVSFTSWPLTIFLITGWLGFLAGFISLAINLLSLS